MGSDNESKSELNHGLVKVAPQVLPGRREYQSPRLVRWGTVDSLTMSGNAAAGDAGGAGSSASN